MQTKIDSLKVVFTGSFDNAINHSDKKEKIGHYLLIDKATEKTIVDCRVYMGYSNSSSMVYASIWVNHIKQSKIGKKHVDSFMLKNRWSEEVYFHSHTSGSGSAGGGGYHKASAAIQSALSAAGIELYGDVIARLDEKPDYKKRTFINGVGDSAIRAALKAIAYQAGYNNCFYVET